MDLITFLKTHTKISNKFIDDFFGLYDSKDKYNFSVDLDKISKWMKVNKSDLKRTLIKSYKKGIDYKITRDNNGINGNMKETILLMYFTMKTMCLFCWLDYFCSGILGDRLAGTVIKVMIFVSLTTTLRNISRQADIQPLI